MQKNEKNEMGEREITEQIVKILQAHSDFTQIDIVIPDKTAFYVYDEDGSVYRFEIRLLGRPASI
jgi:hypothetical protein